MAEHALEAHVLRETRGFGFSAHVKKPRAVRQFRHGHGGIHAFAEIPFWGDLSPWKFEPGLFFEISKPKFEHWNVELRAKADAGKGLAFDPGRMLREMTINTGSIEEIDQLVGRAYEVTANPFNQ